MTITQIECFIEAAKTNSFSKAATNLFISQVTVSRHIKALETELGFPLFERKNLGVKLTEMGSLLYATWDELLITHRTVIDKARDIHAGFYNKLRIGVLDMGNIEETIREAIYRFVKLSPGLDVEYEVLSSKKLLQAMESDEVHIIIVYTSELLKNNNLKMRIIEKLPLNPVIVMSKYHPLARKKKVGLEDLKGQTFAIQGADLSVDYKERILTTLKSVGVWGHLNYIEYKSWPKLEFDLLTGKCVTILYDNRLIGVGDKVAVFPIEKDFADVEKVCIAWKDDKYYVKIKNILDMF